MCLAVPGKLIELTDQSVLMRRGKVDFGGIIKEVHLALVPEAEVDDYVLVHVGVAISIVDEQEAKKVFEYLLQLDALDELEEVS